jgi:hypothetical protein
VRVRYFGAFAKVERLAVRREYRRRGIGHRLVEAAESFAKAKGFTALYAHAQRRLVPFWAREGFRVMEEGRTFSFSDFDYVEVVKDLVRPADAIALGADPFVLIRPEGAWDRPGVLDASSLRGRPSLSPQGSGP